MSEVRLVTDFEKNREELDKICNESTAHFMKVEGRPPLTAFCDIHKEVPELPGGFPVTCYAVLCGGEVAGYAWVMDDTDKKLYYILEFIIGERFRRKKVGSETLRALDDFYSEYSISELLVSANNYEGLNFWVKNGYTEITLVLPPEAQDTVAVEMNLRRHIKR
ncbi:MAG: GNAT family N-acetyltransferase [Ruminiclostridium sp.]|nr:GNAT family N-acetyltransferase [Ruminiclostridium sp.]